ncbi:MAG: hypothetical protein H6737_24815 [Alphaproteobacteria bacterium]|nr:hypothetical protein [Alphaproteobacteria bacterium]
MRTRWAVGSFLAIAVYLWRAWPSLWTTVDDAWISARYAANAAAGHGLVYNAGEPPIEGYTNLAWTLWLAVGELSGAPPDTWMVGSGLVFGVLTVVLAGLLARRLAGRDAWWAPGIASLLVALDGHHAVVSTNGLESSMFDAAVLGAAWAVLAAEGRMRWVAGLAVGLLGAIRPEGFVVGAALVALGAIRHRGGPSDRPRDPFLHDVSKIALPFLGAGLTLTAWRLWTYGDWVPNTFHAKAKGPLSQYVEANLAYLSPDGAFWVAVGVLGLASVLVAWRDPRRWLLAGAALSIVLVAFRVELWMPGGRLLVPAVALFASLIAAASDRLAGRVVSAVALIGMLAAPFTRVEGHVRGYDRRHSVVLWNGTSVAARFVGKRVPEGSWMAVRDAGVLAYWVGTHVKVAELHDRALTQLHPDGEDADTMAFTPVNPEIIVLTQARDDFPGIRYGRDRAVFDRATAPYRYYGRVYQHYHRYYDFYVRADLDVPPLPESVVTGFPGPTAPNAPSTPRVRPGVPVDR